MNATPKIARHRSLVLVAAALAGLAAYPRFVVLAHGR